MLFAGRFHINTRVLFVVVAIALAVLAHQSGVDGMVSERAHSMGLAGAFLIGMFYTLGLTTPTAFIILIEMMAMNNFLQTALVASVAAAAMDTVLFTLLKDALERSAGKLMETIHKRIGRHDLLFSLAGLFMFGSPFPDEFALAFMQISEIKPARIFVVVFLAKFLTLLLVFAAVQGTGF